MSALSRSRSARKVLKTLLHDVPGKICLILEGHPRIGRRETKAFVKSTKGLLYITSPVIELRSSSPVSA
jgi:hypothetical protein